MSTSSTPPSRTELWRLEQLALVSQVATQVTGIYDLDELLVRVVGLIYQTFEFYAVSLYTLDRRILRARAQAGPAKTFSADVAFIPTENIEIPLGQGIIGWVAAHKQELVVKDVWREQRFRYSPEFPNTQAEIALPLKVEDRVLGVLDVQLDYPEDFDDSDLLVLRALAGQVSMAIEDTRLYYSERWRRQVADSLRRISGVLIADVDPAEILTSILTELQSNLPAEALAIWLITHTPKGAAARPQPALATGYRRGSGRKLYLSTLQGPENFRLPPDFDAAHDPWLSTGLKATGPLVRADRHPPDPIAAILGWGPDHSAVVAPIRMHNQTMGLLTLAHSRPGRYGRETISITTAFANQAAVAIENARLFRVAQEEAQINQALLKVAEATQGFADLNEVLTAVARIPPLMAEVDRCAIWLRREKANTFEPEALAGFSPEAERFFKQYAVTPGNVAVIKRLNQTRAPVVIVDSFEDRRLPPDMVLGLNLHTLVLLPIIAHGDMLGLMLVTFTGPASITEDSLRLITGIAHQAAVAIESKYLYDQKTKQERLAYELELARDIQESFIPSQLPALPGWNIAACWLSAQEVSGDFYDLIEVSPHQLGIVMADVAGKGMPAALYMVLARSLARAAAPGQTNPAEVLKRINRLLIPDTRRGRFVSLFYAILNIQTGALAYANAGHNLPLLVRANGRLEPLQARGLVLGVRPDIEPEVGHSQLKPGDGVVFYTDGVTEVFDDAGNIFGEEQLQAVIRASWPEHPAALVSEIRQAVSRFSGKAVPDDDFTLLVLQRS